MRLRAEQLSSRLNSKGLDPVYLISGDEPLQMLECADSIRRYALDKGFEERVVYTVNRDFDWNTLLADTANISLFSSKRLIELRMPDGKPGREGSAALAEYAADPPADNVLIVTTARADKQAQKSKWYTALDKAGVSISIKQIDAASLPGWIKQRVRQQGKSISLSAAEFIAQQVEGNLLAARQEIDKLCLLVTSDCIELDDVTNIIADATRFNVFTLVVSAMSGNLSRTQRMLNSLRSEGVDAAGIYGPLMWELRRLCTIAFQADNGVPLDTVFRQQRVWDDQRKQAIKKVLKLHRLQNLHRLLRKAVLIDRQIKSQDREMAWDSMLSLLFILGGFPLLTDNRLS